MVSVTMPENKAPAAAYEALKLLISKGQPAVKVIAVHAAGDPLASRDKDGVPRETILYVTSDGEPRTALLMPKGIEWRRGYLA